MSLLRNVGGRFMATYYTVQGLPFKGQVGAIPDTSRVSNFLSARRYLRVKPDCFVAPGAVVSVAGKLYICAEHGDSFYVDVINKYFKLIEVDEVLNWDTRVEVTDPVSGVKTMEFESTSPGPLVYLSTQPTSSIKDQMHIPVTQKVAICNRAVQVDDRIGGYKVTKVDQVLGVYLLELKDV